MNIRPGLPAARPPARKAAAPAAPVDKSKYTTLQRHVDFFDRNSDGKITLGETRQGLEALGLGGAAALGGALFINGGLASSTQHKPSMTIDVANIKAAKHDSDSGVIDAQGNFVPEAFDKMFTQFDTNRSNTLDANELAAMGKAHAQSKRGTLASKAEFGLLLKLAADRTETVNGKPVKAISRERLASFYRGDLFPQLAAERAGRTR